MTTLLVSLVVFGVLVLAHEGGHFWAARRAGIRVDEFAIGFGPSLYRWRRGETFYSLRVIPLGGFVKLAGTEPGETSDPRGFARQSLPSRAGVIFAGPAMNLVLAVLLFAFIYVAIGVQYPTLTVAGVLPGKPAEKAGLRPGDRLVEVDGRTVASWEEVVALVQVSRGRPLTFTVQRSGELLRLRIVPEPSPGDSRVGFIGVAPALEFRREAPWRALASGVQETYRVTVLWVRGLVLAALGKVETRLMGPVGIGELIGQAARLGLPSLLYLSGVLSANLALINLIPLPALDGSRLLFLAWEAVRGRPVDPVKESLVHLVGFALLLLFLLVITYLDLTRLGALNG